MSDKSALAWFGVDLTAHASDGLVDLVIGRYREVQRIIQILCRNTKNNPILLGEAGVGNWVELQVMVSYMIMCHSYVIAYGKKLIQKK